MHTFSHVPSLTHLLCRQFQIASCGWETGSSRTLDGISLFPSTPHQRTKQAAQFQFRIHEARPHAAVSLLKNILSLCPLSLFLFIALPFTVIQFLKSNSLFWFFMCRNSLTGKYWGAQEWIHGWGRPGEPMKFCPVQCTINSDTWTHEGPDKGYEKHWDREGWKQPQYSSNTAKEYKAGNTFKKDRNFRSYDTSFLPAIYPPPLLPAFPPSSPLTSLSLEGSYLIAPLLPHSHT